MNDIQLYILKKNDETLFNVEFFDVEYPFIDYIKYFEFKVEHTPEINLSIFQDYVFNTPLKVLFGFQCNYCSKLKLPFEGVKGFTYNIDKIKLTIDKDLRDNKITPYEVAINFSETLHKYHKYYSLENAYKICLQDKSILAYSHVKSGWAAPLFKVNSLISIQFLTNFGYGKSSYFYTILKYKNIMITPFSDWIYYRHCHFTSICRYSRKHSVENQSWVESMNFIYDANNLINRDENMFVETYIINECQKMIDGLDFFLKNSKFEFRKTFTSNVMIHELIGYELLLLRGEKITGALEFISKIQEFNFIPKLQSFANTIEQFNLQLSPILISEFNQVKKEYIPLKKQLDNLYLLWCDADEEYNKIKVSYDKKVSKLLKLKTNMNESDINSYIDEKYPQFYQKKVNYNKIVIEYTEVSLKFKPLDDVYTKLSKFINNIEKHFEKNNPLIKII